MKLEKGVPPRILESESIASALEKLAEFYKANNRSQKRYNFPFNSEIDTSLKPILHKEFHGKCGYCETSLTLPNGIVDRFRPHNGVRDKSDYFPDLYWWLVYEWTNLIYSCRVCSQYKANYFPIFGNRNELLTSNLGLERRMLLNPCEDEPSMHLGYSKARLKPLTDQGLQTIELLNLNRAQLVHSRLKSISEIDSILNTPFSAGKQEIKYLNQIFDKEPHINFLSVKYDALINALDSNPSFGKLIKNYDGSSDRPRKSVTKPRNGNWNSLQVTKSDYFPLEYIHIKNFKSVTDLRIDFPIDDDENRAWLFLLGENGVGKSSVLQALAIGIKSTISDGDNIIADLIQKDKPRAEIQIKERNSDNFLVTVLTREGESITQTGRFGSFLLGYGSLRLASDEGIDRELDLNAVSYENLLHPIKSLNDSSQWLKGIFKNNKTLFDSIAFSVKQLLPHDLNDNLLSFVDNELVFANSEVSFKNFSDGYKSTITLALDIMMKLSSGHADMNRISGIVLIDELGNQLHPRWQMRIVKQLRDVFPRITFVVSTHHPLCLRGSKLGEILLLKDFGNKVEAICDLPDPSELRVDQLLSSEFFGLSSLIDPELEAKFNRYYQLLSIQKKITPEETVELNHLKDELRNKRHLGSSLREELMYAVIDNLLAQKVMFSSDIPSRESLKMEVVKRVKEIWSNLNIGTDDQS